MSFENWFDNNDTFREQIVKILEDKIGIDFEDNEIVTWQEMVQFLEDSHECIFENVAGIKSDYNTLYPFAEYGWDGGYPISTYTFNLNILCSVSIAGGPGASIVQIVDQSRNGLAFHKGVDFFAIHIYG